MTITVIGIGQSLRGDDEAGLAAVRLWQEIFPETARKIRVELAESPGIGLLDLMSGADLVVLVDAVQGGAPPGTIHQLRESDLASFSGGAGSAHGWGVAETLALGRRIAPQTLPGQIILIGIEIEAVAVGETLSPKIEAALPGAARWIEEIVRM